MVLNLANINVGISYNKDIILKKMRVYFPDLANELDADFKLAQIDINKTLVDIYTAAFKSAVPIKSSISKGGRPQLTVQQKQNILIALEKGKNVQHIVDTVSSKTVVYGGTLRNQHIKNNIEDLSKRGGKANSGPSSGLNGRVWVDDELHITPYGSERIPASRLADALNYGQYVAKKSREGSATGSSLYQRSRPSEAEAGFYSIIGPTRGWISNGYKQASNIVSAYLNTYEGPPGSGGGPRTLIDLVKGPSQQRFNASGQKRFNETERRLRQFVLDEGISKQDVLADQREQKGLIRQAARDYINKLAKEQGGLSGEASILKQAVYQYVSPYPRRLDQETKFDFTGIEKLSAAKIPTTFVRNLKIRAYLEATGIKGAVEGTTYKEYKGPQGADLERLKRMSSFRKFIDKKTKYGRDVNLSDLLESQFRDEFGE